MSCAQELEQIATDLINGGSRWFKGNNIKVLQAFIRDEGRCVYCGKKLWEEFGIASCGDHVLPQSRYRDLAQKVENLVAACAECNQIKRDYDPSNGRGMERALTGDIRLIFIAKAKEEIDRRRKNEAWEIEFQIAKRQFREAVRKYRKCIESVADSSKDNKTANVESEFDEVEKVGF